MISLGNHYNICLYVLLLVMTVNSQIPCPTSNSSGKYTLSLLHCMMLLVSGIYLFHRGSCWRNGSYFRPRVSIIDYPLSCVHSAPYNGGGWMLPNGAPCTNSTSPIECNTIATDGPTNVTLQRVTSVGSVMHTTYTCCLPNGCHDGPTDVIVANIYGKLHLQ